MLDLLAFLAKSFLLPPGLNLLVAAFAICILRYWHKLGMTLLLSSLAMLWLMSLPIVAGNSVFTLKHFPPLDAAAVPDAQAIVVLGGRRNANALEYGGDTVGADSLERVRYGAKLSKELGLPLAVTGGRGRANETRPLGQLMAEVLQEEFFVSVRWIEKRSLDTAGNARYLRKMMGADTVILVTHSLHMSRAASAFEQEGFTVHPAPLDIPVKSGGGFIWRLGDWLPSASALLLTRAVLYEKLGAVYYSFKA